MGITGQRWKYVTDKESQYYGKTILNWNTGYPSTSSSMTEDVGIREPKIIAGWNNTFSFYGVDLNVLLDFRFGGDIYNGNLYYMTAKGMSTFTENRDRNITLQGVAMNPSTKESEEVTKEIALGNRTSIQKFVTDYYLANTPNVI